MARVCDVWSGEKVNSSQTQISIGHLGHDTAAGGQGWLVLVYTQFFAAKRPRFASGWDESDLNIHFISIKLSIQ